MEILPVPRVIKTEGSHLTLTTKYRVSIDFIIKGDRFSDEFFVVEGLSSKVIIGAKTLQSYRMKIDFENDEITYNPEVTELQII